MRTLTLTLTAVAMISTVGATQKAEAHEGCRGLGAQLTMELTRLEQLNYGRPRDEFFVNIEHVIGMVRDRINDLYDDRRAPQQVLSMLDDGLYNIQQYNNNGRDRAPYLAAQIDLSVNRMRQQIRTLQTQVAGGYGAHGGYDAGHGGHGSYGGHGGHGGYGPPRTPMYGQTPVYVPPPAPVYRPAPPPPVRPAPIYYRDRF